MTRPRVTSTSTEALGATLSDSRYRLGRLEVSSHTHPGRLLGVIVCTSSTRPSPPEEGMVIWETDTDTEWAYNGTSWIRISPPPVNTLTSIGCKVYRSSNLNILNNTFTDVTWNAEEWDTSGFFTPSSTDVVIPAGLGGTYLLQTFIEYAPNATGIRFATVTVNSLITSYQFLQNIGALFGTAVNVSSMMQLVPGDIVKAQAYQNSTATLAITGSTVTPQRCWLSLTLLGQ